MLFPVQDKLEPSLGIKLSPPGLDTQAIGPHGPHPNKSQPHVTYAGPAETSSSPLHQPRPTSIKSGVRTEPLRPRAPTMASAGEHFSRFFECWLAEQDRDLQGLREAAAEPAPGSAAAAEDEEGRLRQLIKRVIEHYEYYYKAKAQSARRDVVAMFSPKWTSSTENLFIWVGGWRPSAAFHLLYSKSGIQFESNMDEVISGVETRDLAGLSSEQLQKVDELQRRVIRKEREITEEEAAVQEKVANRKMVETADAMTEKVEREVEMVERMEEEMKRRRGDMERVLERADRLRMETMKEIVEMLKPMQAVHFLIAAVELLLRVHEFGVAKDAAAAAAAVDGDVGMGVG